MSGWNPSGPQQPPQPSGPQQPDPAQYPPQQAYPQPQGYPPQQAYPPPPSGPQQPYAPTPPYPPQLMQQETVPSQYHPPYQPQGEAQRGASGPQPGYPPQYAQPSAPQGYPQQPNPSTPLGQSGAQYGQPPYTPTQGYPQPYQPPSSPQGYSQSYTQQSAPPAYAQPGYPAPYGQSTPPPARRGGRLALIIGGVVAALVILGLLVGLVLARGGLGGGGTHSTVQGTATPAVLSSATLGGTVAGFSAKYGAPVSSGATSAIYQATIAGQSIDVLMTLQIGVDQSPHIAEMILTEPSTTSPGWDQATTTTIVTDLIPADSQLDQSQSNNAFGLLRVFVSQSLAHTFTARLFTNTTTNATVTPGTLTVLCLPSSVNSANFGVCTIALGQG